MRREGAGVTSEVRNSPVKWQVRTGGEKKERTAIEVASRLDDSLDAPLAGCRSDLVIIYMKAETKPVVLIVVDFEFNKSDTKVNY